jgi:hypothetical protein
MTTLFKVEIAVEGGQVYLDTYTLNHLKLKKALDELAPEYDSSPLLAILREAEAIAKDMIYDLEKVGRAV